MHTHTNTYFFAFLSPYSIFGFYIVLMCSFSVCRSMLGSYMGPEHLPTCPYALEKSTLLNK